MADREQVLREQTHKDQCDEVGQRIFYTLTDRKELEASRVAKAISLVIVHLQKKNLLTDKELDDLLFDCIT